MCARMAKNTNKKLLLCAFRQGKPNIPFSQDTGFGTPSSSRASSVMMVMMLLMNDDEGGNDDGNDIDCDDGVGGGDGDNDDGPDDGDSHDVDADDDDDADGHRFAHETSQVESNPVEASRVELS